jgi:phosphoribosylglycinamide formyltransferase-1
MPEEFISEAIQPVAETLDTSRMAAGEPGLPRQFRWRSEIVNITRVLRTWRETGPCHHGSSDRYVRKHWFEVLTDSGLTMKIYFERQPRSAKKRMERWWLFSTDSDRS